MSDKLEVVGWRVWDRDDGSHFLTQAAAEVEVWRYNCPLTPLAPAQEEIERLQNAIARYQSASEVLSARLKDTEKVLLAIKRVLDGENSPDRPTVMAIARAISAVLDGEEALS